MIDEKGNVTEVIIVSADPPRHFDKAVIDALQDWKFKAEGEKYVGEIEINSAEGLTAAGQIGSSTWQWHRLPQERPL